MALKLSLFVLLAAKLAFSAAACSQYSVDTSTGTEFFNRMSFVDFRGIDAPAITTRAEEIDTVEQRGLAGITSSYFNTDAFTTNFAIQTWNSPATANNPIPKQNMAQNLLIAPDLSSVSKRAVPFGDHHAAHTKHIAKHLASRHGVKHPRALDKRDTSPRTDGRCGSDFGGATCDSNGAYGGCCSSHGWCGTTPQHCLTSNGCQSGCSGPTPSNSINVSPSTASANSPPASTSPSDPTSTGSPSGGSDGGSTMLSLISTRESDHQSCAQIETLQETLMHASIRLSARVTGSEGACAGIFLYQSDSQESDIEILTSGSNSVFHATNQPGSTDGATKVVDIPSSSSGSGSWSDWHEYRLDWLPGASDWYVDGQLVDSKTVNVPTTGMLFAINLWSDGGSWSGTMPVGNSARLDIRWVQIVYNETSDPGAGAGQGACTVGNGPNAVQG